jgi:mannitol-1-phosphate 5-dehydrogenase
MLESALALSAKFAVPLPDIHYHIRDLLLRFSNRALGDTCSRVGDDTVRKLGPQDRLIGAIRCCGGQDITPAFISAGAGVALYCHLKERRLPRTVETAAATLSEVSGLAAGTPEAALILSFYSLVNQGTELPEIIKAAAEAGNKRGII